MTFKPRPLCFGIKKDESDILDLPVIDRLRLNITSESFWIPTAVGLYEEHEVRVACGYSIPEWMNTLDPFERAIEVAHYRIRRMIEHQKNIKEEQMIASANRRKGV